MNHKSNYTLYLSPNSSSFSTGSGLATNFGTTVGTYTDSSNSNTKLQGNYVFSTQCGPNSSQSNKVMACFNNGQTSSTLNFVSGSNYGTSSSVYNTYSGNKSITLASGQTISGDYITFSFPNPIKLNSYQITHTNQGTSWADRYLSSWALVGSNDNSTWYMVDSFEYNQNSTVSNPQSARTVFCGGDGYYQYYALIGIKTVKNANSGGGVWSLAYFNITSATS